MANPAPKGKFRNKIFLMMALVSVVPILIAAYLSIDIVTITHKTDVARLEDSAISQKEAEVASYINNQILTSVRITTRGDTANATSERALYFDKNLCSNARNETDIENCVVAARRLSFAQFFSANSAFVELSAISLDGKETVRIDVNHPNGVPDSELRDLSKDQGFLSAKKGGDYVGPAIFTPDGPEVFVASLMTNKDGYPLAVAMARARLSGIKDVLRNTALGDTGYVYLVDSDGIVIGGSAAGPSYQFDALKIGIVSQVIAGQDFSGSDGQRRYRNFKGVDIVAAGKSLPDYHWGLIAELPAKEADAIVGKLGYRNGVVSILAFLAVILASILLSTFIVRPIRILEKSSELVAQGKFDTEVKIKTGDELEELGLAFNKMITGLKRLEELKDEFVFIAAHELRTPVGAMKGYLTLILDGLTGPITDKTKDFIQKVVSSNQRLIQLVNDLLEVSRSEGGKLTIKVAPTGVVEPIKSVLVELQSLADKQQVVMAYEPAQNLPKVLADADRLKEVMVNLVGNSIKYMGPSTPLGAGGIVTISHELKNHELITHVSDTGIGMSKDAQAKLFEKFYRVQTDKTRDITGTGLGLFIVKEIVEKMGGKIWASSEGDGKGSTFSFSLPVAG